jgi:hypothetical protein
VRTLQRPIDINPLLDTPGLVLQDCSGQKRRARALSNLLRNLHIVTNIEVTRDKHFLPEAAEGERMALLQKLPALAANGL